MEEIFIGREAIASGIRTRHEVQRWYTPMYPGVHAPRGKQLSLRDKAVGAWLWSNREATITGVVASGFHGAQWVDDGAKIELASNRTRPPHGIITRNESLAEGEVTRVKGLPVTTPARTAFDLGRHLPRGQALARLDALMRATPYAIEDVLLIGKRHPGARGMRQLTELLPLVDGGAASPRETWLRLLFIDAGFPKPTTQIPAVEGRRLVRWLDMGWEHFMVAAEYDGDQHRTDRARYVKDLRCMPKLERLGWKVIRVIKEDREDDIVTRTYQALVSRGWKP